MSVENQEVFERIEAILEEARGSVARAIRFEKAEHEDPTVGIVLCSDKNDAMVEITLPSGNQQILASRYQLHLPTVEELRTELEREREAAELALESEQ